MCSEFSGEQPSFKTSHEARQGADLSQAEKFLCWIAGPDARFQFRAIPERADGKGRHAVNLLGTFAEDGESLAELNLAGYGIFAVVNETAGTTDKDITSIRCVFADFDEIVEGDALAARKERLEYFCGVSPVTLVRKGTPGLAPVSMAVESSPGRFHIYWRTPDFPINRFKPFQAELANVLGSDPSVTNPSRVMRVPGFLHQKSVPFVSRIVFTRSGLPYSTSAVDLEKALAKTARKFLPKERKAPVRKAPPPQPPAVPDDAPIPPETLCGFLGILECVEKAEPGERNNTTHWAACRVEGEIRAGVFGAEFARARLFKAAQHNGLPDTEIKSIIRSASKRAVV